MHPTAAKCSRAHGSASRRRCSYATQQYHKRHAVAESPVERHPHTTLDSHKTPDAA